MDKKSSKRSCISGFVAISFTLVGISGVLMLLHVKNGAIATLHEWIGLLFVVAGIFHLVLNWKAFVKYCKQPLVIVTIVAAVLMGTALLVAGSGKSHRSHENHRWRSGRTEAFNLQTQTRITGYSDRM